ncbi:MAG: zinc-ribbon domain-containing protein, partial [Pseudomonadota bacterium]
MNTCKRCGKDNQDHYKFCLGCGGELVSAPAGAMAKTVLADPPSYAPSGSTQNPVPGSLGHAPLSPMAGTLGTGGAPAPAKTPTGAVSPFRISTPPGAAAAPPPVVPQLKVKPAAGMPSPLSVAGMPARSLGIGGMAAPASFGMGPGVGHGIGIGASANTSTAATAVTPPSGAPATVTPVPGLSSSFASGETGHRSHEPSALPVGKKCPNCGFEIPANFMFCGACGNRIGPNVAMPARPVPVPAPAPEPRAWGRLHLIRPDGSEGGTHDLEEGVNRIGRDTGGVFENDGYLSPLHAELEI